MSARSETKDELADARMVEIRTRLNALERTELREFREDPHNMFAANKSLREENARLRADRDWLAAVIEETKTQTRRGNVMTPPWVISAINGEYTPRPGNES